MIVGVVHDRSDHQNHATKKHMVNQNFKVCSVNLKLRWNQINIISDSPIPLPSIYIPTDQVIIPPEPAPVPLPDPSPSE